MRLILTLVLLVGLPQWLTAHPTAFKGAISAMSFNSPDMNDVLVHYSFSPRISLGARSVRIRERGLESYSVFPQLSLLLWRWNHEKFQANVYTYGGIGANWAQGQKSWSSFYGAEADIEDRQLYFSTGFEHLRQKKFRDFHQYRVRAGFAPYKASFTELASWMIVQYDFKPHAPQRHSVTPLVRLFYRNVLIEAGFSWKGEWLLNFMTHF